jgi:toxin ParE1/3/4
MKYVISNEATNDLKSIWLYTLEFWSQSQADRYLNLILDEIESICKDPTIGKNYSLVRRGYYRTRVKSHFIFYRIHENEIEVVRILHQQMDIDTRLNE